MAFIAAGIWAAIGPDFWEGVRASVLYEPVSKMIDFVIGELPSELWLRFGPSALLVGIGLFLYRRSGNEKLPPAASHRTPSTSSPFGPAGSYFFESAAPAGTTPFWNPDKRQGGPIEWNINLGRVLNDDRLHALRLSGINKSNAAVIFKGAKLSSRITGATVEMKVDLGPDQKLNPEEINPVPAHASIRLIAEINAPAGVGFREFLDEWKELDFTAEYDQTNFTLHFPEGVMRYQFPGVLGRRVTKKDRK